MMVLREIGRRPLRSLLSSVGIAGAVALIILGHFGMDSLDSYLEGTQDLAVTFAHPLSSRAVRELGHLPGVVTAEGVRAVPVRIRQRSRDSVLMGLADGATLRRIVGQAGREVGLPPDGVLVTKAIGERFWGSAWAIGSTSRCAKVIAGRCARSSPALSTRPSACRSTRARPWSTPSRATWAPSRRRCCGSTRPRSRASKSSCVGRPASSTSPISAPTSSACAT
jgi:hypothetical protein